MRSALDNIPEIADLETDPGPEGGRATLKVAKGFDLEACLNAAVTAGNEHIKGWSIET